MSQYTNYKTSGGYHSISNPSYQTNPTTGLRMREWIDSGNYYIDVEDVIGGFSLSEGVGWHNEKTSPI